MAVGKSKDGRKNKTNIAYNMDCLEAMKQMPDNAFDLAVVDPPYGDGSQFQTAARERERERDADGTAKERTADSKTERGVMRTGGTWATKYAKKS